MASQSLLLFLTLLLLLTSISSHGDHHHYDDYDYDDHPNPPNLRSKPLILVKTWCLLIIFFATFLSGISPYFMKWNEGFLVLGTQFAGGVFLGTALMHFLSDSNETFGNVTSSEYPFAFMLASFGYLLTMLADCVISHVYSKDGSNEANADVELQGAQQQQEKTSNNGRSSEANSHGEEGSHFVKPSLSAARSLGDSVLLIVALCSHSVFEGIAIGVAETKSDAWKALWTVTLHKLFSAIAMGIALLRMIPDRPLLSCAAYAFAFAISSPIGVAIGIVIDATTQGQVADWIYAISMGLACGVFVYVAINHLLSKGYLPQRSTFVDKPFYKFLAVMLGIGVIAVVMIWD